MKKRGFVISTTAALVATVGAIGLQAANPSWAGFRSNPKEVVDEVWQIVNREYVDGSFHHSDWEAKRRELLARDYATDEEAYSAIRDALKSLDDPYTRFMDPEQYASMQIDTSGELTGVGLQLGADEKTGHLVVVSPIEESPAFEAGIKSRDVIVAIDGKNTDGMDVNAAVNLIRGEIGTTVKLTVLRNEATQLDFEVERAKIELQTVRYEVHNDNGLKLGYIRLSQFDANSAVKMQQAIQALEKDRVSAYILDLRGNPGGLLYSSAEIARMFLNSGGIVSTVNREGVQDRIDANGHALTEKPLAVLVDGGSASASEILSGALKDNQRATLVGTQTFGKGLVQSVHELSGGAGLAVTIARYLTPNGTDINHKGIAPDVVVELSEQDLERLAGDREALATLGDPQYAAAVKSLGTELAQEAMPGPTAQTAAAN